MKIGLNVCLWTTLVAAPIAVAGQETEMARVTVIPRVGWFTPTGDLFQLPRSSAANPDLIRMTNGLTIAIGIGLDLPIPIVDLEGALLIAVGSDPARKREVAYVCVDSECRRQYESISLDGGGLSIAVIDLVLQLPGPPWVRPRVMLGGGMKWYDYPQGRLDPDLETRLAEDETSRTGHLAVGLEAIVGRMRLDLSASDYYSAYEGRAQHDLCIQIGALFAVF